MRKFHLLIILCGLFCFACNSDAGKDTKVTQNKPAGTPQLPSITDAVMNDLWERVDAADFIFYELPVSMSQDDQASIRQTLLHVQKQTVVQDKTCKPIGRVFFHSAGETLAEAEIYFNAKCKYYVFMEKNKPVYANMMSESGIKFMNQVTNVQTSPAQGQ